jgi:chromosome segregation ATPase
MITRPALIKLERIKSEPVSQARLAPTPPRSTPVTTGATSSRLTMERDALEAQVTSFERSLELVQDETTQLRTQLANWKNLQKGEDTDAEEARKKKVELEQELEEARRRIGELERRAGETEVLETKLRKQTNRARLLTQIADELRDLFESGEVGHCI